MAERVAREQRLDALGSLIADYEAENGVITDEEIARERQLDGDAAAIIRTRRRGVK